MLNGLRRQLGGAALVVAIVALVVALAGAAIAAGGGGGTGDATASAKKKKETGLTKKQVLKLISENAVPGPPGPAGAAGKDGTNGTNGSNGTTGPQGTPGTNGKDGASVISEEFTGNENGCEKGGVEFEVEESGEQTFACNGKEGSPWTAGGVLPTKQTERGTWSISTEGGVLLEALPMALASVSFPIWLPSPLSDTAVHYIGLGDTVPAQCDDGAGEAPSMENPEADPGNLCVFAGFVFGAAGPPAITHPAFPEFAQGAGRSGAMLWFEPETGEVVIGSGTFAVTAP
jgi:hypothetical protein